MKPLVKVRTQGGVSTVIRDLSGKQAPPPSAVQITANAAKAAGRVVRNVVKLEGVKLPKVERDKRMAICNRCEYWDGLVRFGLGKCNHPGCGCTKFKAWLSTETCPAGKWPAVDKGKS